MVNTRADELKFIASILNDLYYKYPEHNNKTLAELIHIVEYRLKHIAPKDKEK